MGACIEVSLDAVSMFIGLIVGVALGVGLITVLAVTFGGREK